MESLKITGMDDIPTVIFDIENKIFQISGRSLPEDVTVFYDPLLLWLDEYAKKSKEPMVFDFKLTYFNTASSKLLLDILLKLEEMRSRGKKVLVRWYYPKDDEDMKDAGLEYADIVEIPFEQIPYSLH
jgi:hypothetical protein